MTSKNSSFPSAVEMEARIQQNLERLQGYIDILLSELNDPDKEGPGSTKEDWEKEAVELKASIRRFQKLLTGR